MYLYTYVFIAACMHTCTHIYIYIYYVNIGKRPLWCIPCTSKKAMLGLIWAILGSMLGPCWAIWMPYGAPYGFLSEVKKNLQQNMFFVDCFLGPMLGLIWAMLRSMLGPCWAIWMPYRAPYGF